MENQIILQNELERMEDSQLEELYEQLKESIKLTPQIINLLHVAIELQQRHGFKFDRQLHG